MAFIYVITNLINQKQYVGKTTEPTIEHRWKIHLNDMNKRKNEKRPLYNAINKYGIENFKIEQLEECSVDSLSKREEFWISKLDTYKNGYNATRGGDGKLLYDYQEIANKYIELQNQRDTAKFFNCSVDTVRTACRECSVKILTSSEVIKKRFYNPIEMLNKDNNTVIKIFDNQSEAARFLQKNNYSHTTESSKLSYAIGRVCRGLDNTCCGFKWRYHLS